MPLSLDRKKEQELEKLYEECLDGKYEICDRCDGIGFEYHAQYPCSKCWGAGKLDWIERVVGKQPPEEWGSSSSSSSSSSSLSSSSSSESSAFNKELEQYIEKLKGNKHDKNRIRSRTIQRLHQVFDELKGRL